MTFIFLQDAIENRFREELFCFIIICMLDYIRNLELNALLAPVNYYKSVSGKNTRSILCEYLGIYYNIEHSIIQVMKYVVNECHNASLVIDDIQDNSLTRRKVPCAHLVYGVGNCINAGYLNAFRILHEFPSYIMNHLDDKVIENIDIKMNAEESDNRNINNDVNSKKIMLYRTLNTLMIEHLYNIHIGQGLDLYWTTHKIIPTYEDYLKMINYKTGILFKMIIDVFSLFSKRLVHDELEKVLKVCDTLCYFFQIRDDYVNITDPNFWKQKGICEDFDEKKQSYIIVTFYHDEHIKKEVKDRFFSLFYKPNLNFGEKKRLLSILYHEGVLTKVYVKLLELKEKAQEYFHIPILFERLYIKEFNPKILLDSYHTPL